MQARLDGLQALETRLKSAKALPAADEDAAAIKTLALELMIKDEAPAVQPRGPKKQKQKQPVTPRKPYKVSCT